TWMTLVGAELAPSPQVVPAAIFSRGSMSDRRKRDWAAMAGRDMWPLLFGRNPFLPYFLTEALEPLGCELVIRICWRFCRHLQLHLPEVGPLHQLIVAQAADGAVQHHLAGLQHIAIVGDRKRHVRILLHHEDGGALLVDGLDDLEHLLDQGRRQPHRR